jgi:lysine 2,3-aminomutase
VNAEHITKLEQVRELSERERAELRPVEQRFAFRSNTYYQGLIDWNDPHDPIRRLVIPELSELLEGGELDASEESAYTRVSGLQHKYRDTALLLVNDVCGAYCRFCFRKRLFLDDNHEVVKDVSQGLQYIASHPEITNVLLTGGDPLLFATSKLKSIIEQIRRIDHVKIIRIGSKMPAFNPRKLYSDDLLMDVLRAYSTPAGRIYIMAHFSHPRELTPDAIQCLDALQRAGAITVNQTPMIAGINDNPEVLAELLSRLSFAGVTPYYVFQCRPTMGNSAYSVPLEKACQIFQKAQARCSGLAKRARFVMSHASGKIEIVAVKDGFVYMKYLQAASVEDEGRFMVLPSNKSAHWMDDYRMETNVPFQEALGAAV